jgi:hypothetical protein
MLLLVVCDIYLVFDQKLSVVTVYDGDWFAQHYRSAKVNISVGISGVGICFA